MTDARQTANVTILSGSKPIERGQVREVWDRPGHPRQILKTIHAGKRQKYLRRAAVRRAFDDSRLGPYGTFRIEYQCYMKTAYKCVLADRPIPIAEIGGLVITDHGLAQVCEKIADASGGLAMTLEALLKTKSFESTHVSWLNELADTLFNLNVNVPDLKASNVVIDEARQQFVLVDGYGDKTLIPIRSWCRPLNQKQLDTRFGKMAVPGFLHWNPNLKKFLRV